MAGNKLSVFLFVPNVIGYGRIVLLICACWFMQTDCWTTVVCYVLAGLLDALDGYAARLLNQSTRFGAMLDMLTDRMAIMCLVFCLTIFYPQHCFIFQMSMLVDISSHWLHVHTAIVSGKQSHKTIASDGNPLLRIYYQYRTVMTFLCIGSELFHVLLYVRHFYMGPTVMGFSWLDFATLCTAPVALAKFAMSCIQLCEATINMGAMDQRLRSE